MKYEIIKFVDGEFELNVNVSPEEDTVWLNAKELAFLFDRDESVINKHIRKIYKEGELDEETTEAKNAFMLNGREYYTKYYNLDVVFSLGAKVKSERGILFRKWARKILKEYMIKGYTINEIRCLECKNRISELELNIQRLKEREQNQLLLQPGEELKSFAAIERFLQSAKKEILIIDNYFGKDFDSVLEKINVEKTIITNINNKKIETCSLYKVIKTNEFHDRYIIVDNNCFHFGSSIGDLGTKISHSTRISDASVIQMLKRIKEK